MIDIDNQTSFEIDRAFLEKVLQTVTQKDVELIVTTNAVIQEINREYRNIDKPTDVLSFPYEAMPLTPLGSIVISVDFVQQKAEEFSHSQNDEFSLLFIHGLLHLLGYDHEVDNGQMRAKEEELIYKFKLPKSLIVRTEGE
ncbi:Metal-dependent hydrolase YbeY, involved in rRNA and/or ribosome maturation and assembly [hydrothermal vent metagenome]|uniref:Metal-dependent hydrolase YbeY, involved in rRNA and/or ribosome maturation and assembly n=1 Tax=hydrothermal vent metagenome TaxID=652676 RepID=A0A1W1CSV5_9ZZZZ